MPLENITVSIPSGHANPQTKTIQVNVNPATGTGTGTISYTGNNGGLDAAVATANIGGHAYTSNTASIAWQVCPSVVSIGPISLSGYFSAGTASTVYTGLGTQRAGPLIFNSLIINQVVNNLPIIGIQTTDGNSGEFKLVPPHVDQVKSDGTALNGTGDAGSPLPYSGASTTVMTFTLVVKTAGVQTFYFLVDDSWGFYVGGGATRAGGSGSSLVTSPATPNTFNGLNLMGCRNSSAHEVQPTDAVYVSFPGIGTYSGVLWWVNGNDNQTYCQTTFAAGTAALPPSSSASYPGSVILPVTLQPAPPPTTPAGNLQLSISNGNQQITGQSVTLTVNVTGITYSTENYIPLLEGTTGKLFIYNSPSSAVFNYPLYPPSGGSAVDKTAAVTSDAISLSGSNTSWQGRLQVVYNAVDNANAFELFYGGSGFDSHVDTTSLTITADDVAWYNGIAKTFDLYTVSGGGGGAQFQITVDYLVRPNPFVASVTPKTVTADGLAHTFTVTLTKPISPRQQGTQFGTGNTLTTANPTFSGGVSLSSITPILDSGGWLTGWTVVATVPFSSANGSFTMSMNVSGSVTYLNGSVFTTGTITYVNGVVGTVTTTGSSFKAPTNFTFSPPSGFSGSITLSATVMTTDSGALSLSFYRQLNNVNTLLGTGSKTSGPTAVSGGFVTTFQITVATSLAWGSPIHFGYIATDALSNLSLTYFSSTASVNDNTTGGGGGGGGCPAADMWVDDYRQVALVMKGQTVQTLIHDPENYVGFSRIPSSEVESRAVEWTDTKLAHCYHLIAENGAEVIISHDTPVPTRESAIAFQEGHPVKELPIMARDITAGMNVITDIGNGPEWALLTSVKHVGEHPVCRLYCGGRNFAAGVHPGRYIYTHNLQIVK